MDKLSKKSGLQKSPGGASFGLLACSLYVSAVSGAQFTTDTAGECHATNVIMQNQINTTEVTLIRFSGLVLTQIYLRPDKWATV